MKQVSKHIVLASIVVVVFVLVVIAVVTFHLFLDSVVVNFMTCRKDM